MIDVVICADDYGLTPGISEAIRLLIAAGRVSATSVMMTTPWVEREIEPLLALSSFADIGIHLVLTEQQLRTPLWDGTAPSVMTLLRRAYLGQLPMDQIETELRAQIEAFIQVTGRSPDHIDGHHHIHSLPGIRELVIKLFQEYADPHTYMRSCYETKAHILKKKQALTKSWLISQWLGKNHRAALMQHHIPHNAHFRGIYNFQSNNISTTFKRFLDDIMPHTLIMCHPGMILDDIPDPISSSRKQEFDYMLSDAFARVLSNKQLRVRPFAAPS